ncbi:MAG: hypothetical protein KIT43_10345 [Bauldia sp.]|nr:hypothetical protein [Bauldia sp.]
MFYATRPPKLALLKAWGKVVSRSYDSRESVGIFASGRGGSTWLSEVICAPRGTILQYEPFHSGSNPTAARFGVGGRPHFTDARPPTASQQRFLRGLFDGSILNFETAMNNQRPRPGLMDFVRFRRFVAKFISANLALDWITKNLGIKAVLLLRHPCAVVSSQLAYGDGWRKASRERIRVPESVFEDFPHFGSIRDDIETTEEALAFVWAVEALVPLVVPVRNRRWRTVFYEDLAMDPVTGFQQLFDDLRIEHPPNLADIVRRPSRSVTQTVKGVDGWRRTLHPDQVSRILSITARMGVDFYDDRNEPLRESRLISAIG